MLRRDTQAHLTLGVCILCLLSANIGFVSNAWSTPTQVDEGDILKMRDSYPTRDEYPYLPGYCAIKREEMLLNNESRDLPPNLARARQSWVSKLGEPTWTWLHHYCAGINRIRRYEQSVVGGFGGTFDMTAYQKDTLLYALKEFGMIEPPFKQNKSPLYAGSIVNHAKALRLLGRVGEAISKLSEGISVEPTSDLLYLNLAQILVGLGDKKQAVQVLELGYKRTNGSKRINEMLSNLK